MSTHYQIRDKRQFSLSLSQVVGRCVLYGYTESSSDAQYGWVWLPGTQIHCNYVMGVSATFCIVYSVGKYSLPSATKLRRLCFHRRVSVHGGRGTWSRGVPAPGGTCSGGSAWSRGVPGHGGCLVTGGAWSWGVSVPEGGGWYPSMH